MSAERQPRCPKCKTYGAVHRVYRRHTAPKRGYGAIGYRCDPAAGGWHGKGCAHVWMDDDPTKGGAVEPEPTELPRVTTDPPQPPWTSPPEEAVAPPEPPAPTAAATLAQGQAGPVDDDEAAWTNTTEEAVQADAEARRAPGVGSIPQQYRVLGSQ